ncbi:PIR protein [Plasmodium ovale]|uniref:PIR protein n=1 Tax=Plasmodium ovale TaxID=36330 RepID=A0A1C3KJB1_PLAOA|nr:PIR protein [Plasmodium ovale]
MTNCEEDITSECQFFDDSKVKSIHEEFRNICDNNSDNQRCCTEPQDNLECCSIVADKMKKLKSKFNQILQSYQVETNAISSYRNAEDIKIQCICLKKSFYDKVLGDKDKLTNVYKFLNTCKREIRNKINGVSPSSCTFRNLNIEETERIKKIYGFYLFYYRNIKDLAVDKKLNDKPKGFRKGFYELCSSIIECLHDTSKSEYCEEFKEFNNKYNAFRVFLKSLISYPEKIDGSDCKYGCVLSQRLLNGQYHSDLREEIKRIRSRYHPTNFQTIAITVVFLIIGTITPREFWVRIRKLKNEETHAIVEDETENNSLFTSESLEHSSKRKGYSISYKSAKYS